MMTTYEEAKAAQLKVWATYREAASGVAIVPDPNEAGSWALRLNLRREIPVGTIPSQIDGITIITEVRGQAEAI